MIGNTKAPNGAPLLGRERNRYFLAAGAAGCAGAAADCAGAAADCAGAAAGCAGAAAAAGVSAGGTKGPGLTQAGVASGVTTLPCAFCSLIYASATLVC